LFAALELVLERADMRREESMEGEHVSFLLGESGAFVEAGVVQQIVAG
jgi:hypothetical protein